jgi:hypothetical protein
MKIDIVEAPAEKMPVNKTWRDFMPTTYQNLVAFILFLTGHFRKMAFMKRKS